MASISDRVRFSDYMDRHMDMYENARAVEQAMCQEGFVLSLLHVKMITGLSNVNRTMRRHLPNVSKVYDGGRCYFVWHSNTFTPHG